VPPLGVARPLAATLAFSIFFFFLSSQGQNGKLVNTGQYEELKLNFFNEQTRNSATQ
jgi:hypothetical protein